MSTVNGSLPRVSTILRVLDDAYAGVPQSALDKAAERGEALHRLCLTYLASLGGMCEEPHAVWEGHAPAFFAFVKWCTDNQVEPVAVEQEGVNTLNGFRGHPDALILFGPDKILVLIDLKFTAALLRINRVQVQAYWRLNLYIDASRVLLVHIRPLTGELKVHPIKKNPADWAAFLNALSVWRWRNS